LQAADSREGNNGADADGAQGGNVSPRRDLMGSNLVMQAVSAEEGNRDRLVVMRAFVVQDRDGRGGASPWSRD
jgi:hypothetical protein